MTTNDLIALGLRREGVDWRRLAVPPCHHWQGGFFVRGMMRMMGMIEAWLTNFSKKG